MSIFPSGVMFSVKKVSFPAKTAVWPSNLNIATEVFLSLVIQPEQKQNI